MDATNTDGHARQAWKPNPEARVFQRPPEIASSNWSLTCNPKACLVEDDYINALAATYPVSALEDTAIGIDATYYLQRMLTVQPSREPLLTALGGLTGISTKIEADLDEWQAHNITPAFIFDGQVVAGQDEVFISRATRAIEKSNSAWELYVNGQAQEAVDSFGKYNGAFRVQKLYPMLQAILKQRNIYFLVAPYSACHQLAYFDMIDSDQIGGIMGPQELLLYPINDCVISKIDWEANTVTAHAKRGLKKVLGVSEGTFTDAVLMAGTSFLNTFPGLKASPPTATRQGTVVDAINMLRASDRNVATACHSFSEDIKAYDPDWLDKFQKAKMMVKHFIYITEDCKVKVHDWDHLTKDNLKYLGFQLPEEAFHYLSQGLIGPRILSWITHSKITVLPTIDGQVSDEYRKLVTTDLVAIKEMTLALIISRVNRGIQFHGPIKMRAWFDEKFSPTANVKGLSPSPSMKAATWMIKDAALKKHPALGDCVPGSIAFEVLSLLNLDFAKSTVAKNGSIKALALDSADVVVSVSMWRMLHLRGYVTDTHGLTPWGQALAVAMAMVQPTVEANPGFKGLYEALLVAFEMLRYGVLHGRHSHEESHGLPLNGTDEDKASLLLLSRAATLLKLRHAPTGYTGPLNKTLLVFSSLASTVREADRDLVEAVLASLFMYGQADRWKHDLWDIGRRLPFLNDPDIAFGIAIKTLLDEVTVGEAKEARKDRIETFPGMYLPHATNFDEDLEIFYSFFEALAAGVRSLPDKEGLAAGDKAAWARATKYLQLRR